MRSASTISVISSVCASLKGSESAAAVLLGKSWNKNRQKLIKTHNSISSIKLKFQGFVAMGPYTHGEEFADEYSTKNFSSPAKNL